MLQLVGLLLLFSSATLLGTAAASALSDREKALGTLIRFLRQFAIQLNCLRSPPSQLVARLAASPEYQSSGFVQALQESFATTESFREALSSALELCREPLDAGVEAILLPLGESIGTQPLENQLAAIQSAVLLLEEHHTQAVADYRTKGSLYRKLGVLGGGLLVVLFA